ncbi:MAG: hypothetical protein VW338_03800 [Rhodospirillaceae bacterium]
MRFHLILVACAAVALGGCETTTNTMDRITTLWSKPIVYPCPDYRILKDAARLTAFRPGPGRDLLDVDVQAAIGDARLECLTFVDKDTKKGHMEANFAVVFGARRGPANTTRKATLPYFVSVTDTKRNVLYRETFQVTANFAGNQTEVQFPGETIKLELPLTAEIKSQEYIIFTGFALSREQLEFNRNNPN